MATTDATNPKRVPNTVIAVSGGIGAGKRTLSEALAERLGGRCVGFGDEVRRTAEASGLDAGDPDVLQSVGQAMVVDDCAGLVDAVLAPYLAGGLAGPLVVHGLRHVEVLMDLKERCAGPFRLLHVDGTGEARSRRLLARAGTTYAGFARLSAHLSEEQVDRILPQYADARVEGHLPLGLLVAWAIWKLRLDGSPAPVGA